MKPKTWTMFIFLIGAAFLTYYYHVILASDIIFTHLFYIPITLAAIWWKRRGIFLALFLGFMLLVSHVVYMPHFPITNDVFRVFMFVAAAAVIAMLSEEADRANILYKRIADSSHTGIYIIQDGKFRFLNLNAALHTGYPVADLITMDPSTIIHPDDRKLVKESAIGMLKHRSSVPYEYRIVDKGGKIRHLMETVTPIDYQGHGAVLGNVLDITDRKQNEEALRFHNQRFFEVLNSLDALVYVTDMQSNELLFINRYGHNIWGDIEGKICWQTIQSGQTGPCEFCTNDRLLGEDGKPTDGIVWEFQNTVNGHWYECRDRAITWPDGRIVRIEIATDITARKQNEEEIDLYRKRIELILESVGDGIYGVDRNGRTIFANPSALRITGYEEGDLIGGNQHSILHHTRADGSCYPVEECHIHQTLNDGRNRNVVDDVFWKKDGTSFPVEYVVTPMIKANQLSGAVVVFKDISDRKRAAEELQRSEERYRSILENIEDGYHEVDLSGNFTFGNESFRQIMGYTWEELLGMNYKQYAADEDNAKKVFAAYNQVFRTGEPLRGFDWDIITKDGRRRTVEVSVSLLKNTANRPEGFRGIVRDITERKQKEEEIRILSITDQLTGLYNRRGFIALAEQQIKNSIRAKRKLMMAFIDIDGMKWINDTFGHEVGDRALLDTATVLRKTFRESDIIARMGGDEFAVLAIDVTDMHPEILSNRLQQIIDIHNMERIPYSRLSMSWGATIYDPSHPVSLDQLMATTDTLMYDQKKSKTKLI